MSADPALKREVAEVGGRVEVFGLQVCLYEFPLDNDAWEKVRETEIDQALGQIRKAITAWADKARREVLRETL